MSKYQGITYRPLYEAKSLLLQVTRGCSHGKCSFCTMYRDVPFCVEPEEEVMFDIAKAGEYYPHTKRVFLEHGDPFCLSADRLIRISEAIHEHLPEVETIAMYASVKNIMGKTDAELEKLAALGIDDLNIGVESGLDYTLELLNKGYTAAQALYELRRLTAAGISYGANVIFGAAGAGRGLENAEATAELLNAAKPNTIFTGTIHSSPGAPLWEDMKSGRFIDATIGEYIDEEERLLQLLDQENCRYYSTHPSNISLLKGKLPLDRERLLSEIARVREKFSPILGCRLRKEGEEGIILGYIAAER